VRLIQAPEISELPNGSETFACTTRVSLGDQTVAEAMASRMSTWSIRTYVVVSKSRTEAAKVAFIASNASVGLEAMLRPVSGMRPERGNVWLKEGKGKANGW